MVPRIRSGMDSRSSLLDFSPLIEIHDGTSVAGEDGGKVADSASQEPRRNVSLTNDKEENEDGDDEVFSSVKENNTKLKGKRPGRPGRKRTTSEPGIRRNVKYPCGVCKSGVGNPGVICGACGLWIHNGKIKNCTGLNGKEDIQVDTFRCPKCIKSNHKINLILRNKT